MLRARSGWGGVVLVGALAITACKGKHIDGDDVDYEQSATDVCAWQRECLDPTEWQREFGSIQRCVELELYRHAEPPDCLRANEAFKRCMIELSCEEFDEVRAQFEALTTNPDAGVPEGLPCLLDLLFYNVSCGEWSCDNGQIINRQNVCDLEDDCADRSDEQGCP